MPWAVRPVPTAATASGNDTWSGTGSKDFAAVTACSAYPPGTMPRWATTRRPSQESSTPWPTRSTMPATSRPGMVGSSGGGIGPGSPRRRLVSRRCTPLASTATRTWPAAGVRSGSSSRTRLVAGPNS